MKEEDKIGIILSGATTERAKCEVYSNAEDMVEEGILFLVNSKKGKILARVDRVIPYHEFYREGDPWSDARRQQLRIPTEIARKYKIAELELLGKFSVYGLSEVTLPPDPGEEVVKLEVDSEIFKGLTDKEGIILFGTLYGYENLSIPLDIENITMHMAVFGSTGSGKSYTVGYLLELLSNLKSKDVSMAFPTIIVDANGDYLDYFNYYVKHKKFGSYFNLYRFVFSKSRIVYHYDEKIVKKIKVDLNEFLPRELAELIVAFRTGGTLNELQVSGLELVLKELREMYARSYNEIFYNSAFFEELLNEVEIKSKDGFIHHQTAKAIKSALEYFRREVLETAKIIPVNKPTLSGEFIDKVSARPSLVIIDFSTEGSPGISLQLKQLVIAYLTKILYNKFVEYKTIGKEERFILLIIEEAQNYCPNPNTYPIGYTLTQHNLSLIATQGRKFGVCLCLVTQRPSFVDPIILSMSNNFFIHRISVDDVSYVKKLTGGLPRAIESKLVNLRRGSVVVHGQMNLLNFPVLVSLYDSRKIKPTIGKTNLFENLKKIYKNESS